LDERYSIRRHENNTTFKKQAVVLMIKDGSKKKMGFGFLIHF